MILPSSITDFFINISSIDVKISLALCLSLCILFAYPAIKRKWLSPIALLTTTMVALIFCYKLGIAILIFPFLFVLIGSLISNKEIASADKKARSAKQVLANSGVALIYVLGINNTEKSIPLIILVFAIALADTMSSEIGKKFRGPTYNICGFKKISVGLSGGISLIGSLAGLAGSFIIALAALLYSTDIRFILFVGLIGFIGMLVDSFIGSIAQGKYLINEKITEDGPKEDLVNGFHFFDNDVTNFVSILVSTFVFL